MAFEDRPTRDVDARDHARATALLEAGEIEAGIAALQDLVTRRIWYFPGHVALGRIHRDRGEKLLALKHFSLALKFYPRRPELHIEFADHMVWECAIGMAKLYYQQALHVDPGNAEARAKLSELDGPAWTEAERGTFFVSYSDDAAPKRLHGCDANRERRKDEKEFPDISKLEEIALHELELAE
jgi:tetratricopeptide (TPR) repeat protein